MIARLEPKTRVLLIFAGVLAILLWSMMQRLLDVAAVQDAVERDWEISFSPPEEEQRPAMLPEFLNRAVEDYLDRRYEGVAGSSGGPVHTRNRHEVYHQRFCSLFRGRIRQIRIYYPAGFRDDLGAALARFPHLQIVTVQEASGNMVTEEQWTLLCQRLRQLPNLEELELSSESLTDAAIAPLSGHPRMRKITIDHGRLTPVCVKTFASMPRLATLDLSGATTGTAWSPSETKGVRDTLPRVNVTAP